MQIMVWIYQIIILIKKFKCDIVFSTQKLKGLGQVIKIVLYYFIIL
jgi:hypothetical protein